jgi:hypothetical protein
MAGRSSMRETRRQSKKDRSSPSVFTEARARRMMGAPGAGRPLLLFTLLALALVASPAAATLRYQHHLSDSRNHLPTVDDDGWLLLVRVCRVHSTAPTYADAAHSRRRCDFVSVGDALAAARDHSVVEVEAGRYLESTTIRVRATNVTLRYNAPSLVRPSWPLNPPSPQPPPNPNDDL